MKLVDTHAHLYLRQFDADRAEVLESARKAGIEAIYLPNIDSTTIGPMLELEADSDGLCHAMMGLHPCSVKAGFEQELETVVEWLRKRSFCAVGEIGIDMHWDTSTLEIQKVAFRFQVELAARYGLPIVIHARQSLDILIDLLEAGGGHAPGGIFHCFTGTVEQARRITAMGFHLGIGGVLTYKKAGLTEVVRQLPAEVFVLETDSPYLAPVPFRGKRNESAYVKIIAQHLADALGLPLERIADITTANAQKIFRKNQG